MIALGDLMGFGIDRRGLDEWVEFFRAGEECSFPLDVEGARRRHRNNTAVLVVSGGVAVAAVVGVLVLAVLDLGRVLTYVLLVLLTIGAAALFVKFFLSRRRVRAGLAGASEFLRISLQGIRVAEVLDLPWTVISGGVGTDGRGTTGNRLAMRVSRASGIAETEMTLGLRGTRALRDGAPQHLRHLFEVIWKYGGIRLPLDTMLAHDDVRPALMAMAVAGRMAGVQVDLPREPAVAFKRVVSVLNPELGARDAGEHDGRARAEGVDE